MTFEDRFWDKVIIGKKNECWLWTASITGVGYGHIYRKGKFVQAHRVAYELCVGKIPKGLDLDHLCRNRLCVNPRHLEPVTRQVNLLRGATTVPAMNAAKTHCPKGHEYTPDNIYRITKAPTTRLCRTCYLDKANAYYAKTKKKVA